MVCIILLKPFNKTAQVRRGTLLHEAARLAGIDLHLPCGGQGRCGRCAVILEDGSQARRRSTLRLSQADLLAGYALACQTVVEGDIVAHIPPQERVERRLTTDKTAVGIELPLVYDPGHEQPLRALPLRLPPPTLDDNTDDLARLQRELARQHGIQELQVDLPVLRRLGRTLREAEWVVTAVVEMIPLSPPGPIGANLSPPGPPILGGVSGRGASSPQDWGVRGADWKRGAGGSARLIDVHPSDHFSLWGIAIDIGTTSNVVYLLDLQTGRVVGQAADYNAQLARGEDIISRIIYASKDNGLAELQALVVGTLNRLIERVCRRQRVDPMEIVKVTVAGNTTMLHLFAGLPPAWIRLTPYIPAANQIPAFTASQVGLNVHPQATVDCLPGVASYVGADITAGAVSSGLATTDKLTLFVDVGTNGEMVLGNRDWLVACACSAGPAFEGAGVEHGMRATEGAIEEVWIHSATFEPTVRVIGGGKPHGLCGSGLIALLAELFVTGVIDKAGNLRHDLGTPRVRRGAHGDEYVVAWAEETATGRDIVLTRVDIDNLMRAKAAIYAGFSVLAQSVGIALADVEQVLIGGAFGQYLNVEKAVQIGLLPDMPWERFQFLGNTSVRGAAMALLSQVVRRQMAEVARKMTYLELSMDNRFHEEFMSAMFLPHTEVERFPRVHELSGR